MEFPQQSESHCKELISLGHMPSQNWTVSYHEGFQLQDYTGHKGYYTSPCHLGTSRLCFGTAISAVLYSFRLPLAALPVLPESVPVLQRSIFT